MAPSDVSIGPHGVQVTHFLERVTALTPAQWAALGDATPPLRRHVLGRLRAAAALLRAVRDAEPKAPSVRRPGDVDAVCDYIEDAVARGAVPDESRDLAIHAGIAVLLHDILPPADFAQWYGPFELVIPSESL